MIVRYVVMFLIFVGALVVEETMRTLPVVGALSPNCGLLFIAVYAMKAECDQFWMPCFWAGLLKGSLVLAPCGYFMVVYLLIVWIVLQVRGVLYLEFLSTQIIVVFFAGCLQALVCALVIGAGLYARADWIDCLRVIGSSATAALLAPAAVRIYVRSRFIRTMLGS